MSPTIVLDPRGIPLLITGACGGPHIITAVFQIMSNVVDYGMDIGVAVSAPRFHHQHLPDTLLLEEDGFSPDAVATLHSFGHVTRLVRHLAISPSIARKNGAWHGSSDPRLEGAAVGF